jgi:hypothetical protein
MLTPREKKRLNSLADEIYSECCLMDLKRYGNREATEYIRETISKKAGKYRGKRGLSEESRQLIDSAVEEMLYGTRAYVEGTRERLGYGEPESQRKFTKTRRFFGMYGKIIIPAAAAASVPVVMMLVYRITGDPAPVEDVYRFFCSLVEDVPKINFLSADHFECVTPEKMALSEALLFGGLGGLAGVALDGLSDLLSRRRGEEQYGQLRKELKRELGI